MLKCIHFHLLCLSLRRKSTFVCPKSILKLPKLHLISEQDEHVSENGSPERIRKESDGRGNSENLNSKPEADQLEMTTYPNSGQPTECVLECSECVPEVDEVDEPEVDEVDGVTFAPIPDKNDLENDFEIEEPKKIQNVTSMTNENEFEQTERKLPTLRIIRILGGMGLALAIIATLFCPLGLHYVAKEHKKSYLYYEIPSNDGIAETHIIQVRIMSAR